MKQELYAFWKYDTFPFCLGGQVTNMKDDGIVETVGYGKGSWFTPFKIVPLERGRALANQLEILRRERDRELDLVYAKYLDKRNAIITIPK